MKRDGYFATAEQPQPCHAVSPVMLSGVKHLGARRGRSFAALRMTRGESRRHLTCHAEEHCHAERSEASASRPLISNVNP
jgi:hypothetical protein